MGYVDGENLASRLKHGPLPAREAAQIVEALAEAVHYAHQHGIIHRDLKPSNVLLGTNGPPRITDFGLAKQIEGNSTLTATGQILGTPSYMPPEQAQGSFSQVKATADIYSLGAVLYELVTGGPPFRAASVWETINQVIAREAGATATAQSGHRPRLGHDLSEVSRQGTRSPLPDSSRPGHRFGSVLGRHPDSGTADRPQGEVLEVV